MVTVLTEAFKDEFQVTLDKTDLSPNDHFEQLVGVLKKHGLVYELEDVHCKYFMTHKENRGKLLLSPHNAHKNAAGIHSTGAQLDVLTNAWCTELPSQGNLRSEQIEKNKSLIERSGGMLAELNGEERYCTLGTGHTTAFCKLAAIGGITSEKILQCADSNKIDVQKICQNKNFDKMIKVGWKWKVVPALVDEAFPKFARIAQKALNTRNHVASQVSELEACMTLLNNVNDPGFRDLENFKHLAVENIVSLCVPCAGYANCLLDYVLAFAGGESAPMIEFIESVGKGFQCNVTLGETFWKALTYTEFFDKTSQFPLVRSSVLLANLTTDKIEDGVARLLHKSDVVKVASKSMAKEVNQAEQALQESLQIVSVASTIEKQLKPLGLFFVRYGLKLTKREKQGREGVTYSIQQIKETFLKDVGEIVGNVIEYSNWTSAEKGKDEPASSKALLKEGPFATLNDHSDPVWIASQKGFSVGATVVERQVELHPERLYAIFGFAGKVAQLHQIISYSNKPKKVDVALDELLKNWSVTKTEHPIVMQEMPNLPESVDVELHKVECFKAVMSVYNKHVNKVDLAFYRKPDEVRTRAKVQAGKLVLAPAVPYVNITTKNTSSQTGYSLGSKDGAEYFVLPAAKPAANGDEWGENAFVVPFWWVSPTTNKKEANVALEWETCLGIDVPIFKNAEAIDAFSKLRYYVKAKRNPEPLQNVIDPSTEQPSEEPSGVSQANPKKRVKK